MTRGLAAACAGLALGLVAAAAAGSAPAAKPRPKPAPKPAVQFSAKGGRLTISTSGYRLAFDRRNGDLVELVDRRTGTLLLRGQTSCAWGITVSSAVALSGCAYAPDGANRFSYRWSKATSTLLLEYRGVDGPAGVDAIASVTAEPSWFDLRLRLSSGRDQPIVNVLFPGDLLADAAGVEAGYAPTFLPGVRFSRGFFTAPHRNVEIYPSRWMFADYLAADIGGSHLALYSVNPAPAPIAPVDMGFVRNSEPASCSGDAFCLTHAFETWIRRGDVWTSPVVRVRVGGSVEQTMLAYREDNGIGDYPSLRDKLGTLLDVLARAPLVKADLWKGLPEFAGWQEYLRRLPSPALLHPVAFQPGGHDEDYPDFLPPDPRWGSLAQFNAALDAARSLGMVVMPYLNVSWWDTQAPSVLDLPPPEEPKDIAVQTQGGVPVREQFGSKDGYIVSPSAPAVRARVERLFDEWTSVAPAECLFFDQVGARPWRRDFNPAAPTPLAYYDGWLSLFAPETRRCVMAEDGWDRLAASFAGFHGGILQMSRQAAWPDDHWEAGNWAPYPLALWLFHDKVLMYQHDLYEGSFTEDPETLTFNLAFGLVMSVRWDGEAGSLGSPWLATAGAVQRTLGPLYVGKPLTSFTEVAPSVTESVFGDDFSVVANWSRDRAVEVDGRTIAPLGFMARRVGGEVLAGTFGTTWAGVSFARGGAR